MESDWTFWFCEVDGFPTSNFVDLGFGREAPVSGYSLLGHVRLQVTNPKENGLSSSEEYQTLCDIEDALARICADPNYLLVGRSTSRSRRVFYFYIQSETGFTDAARAVMADFPAMRTGSKSKKIPLGCSIGSFFILLPMKWIVS